MKLDHILVSRTDSIGDVMLTLPLVGLLRQKYPQARISFLGMSYTRPVIEACEHVDHFINWQILKELPAEEAISQLRKLEIDLVIHVFPRREIVELAKKAGIPKRLGTTGRWYNWLNCNILVPISRKRSNLHEAILNIKLASKILDSIEVSLTDIPSFYGFSPKLRDNANPIKTFFDPGRLNIILHPRSKGSAREWGLENFAILANLLAEQKVSVYITGTAEEGNMLRKEGFFEKTVNANDLTGKFDLDQLILLIQASDGIIAGSTGPLHIASALDKIAIGLYPPIKPMDPTRWAPLGKKAAYLVAGKQCNECRKSNICSCMQLITPGQVQQKLNDMVLIYDLNHKLV